MATGLHNVIGALQNRVLEQLTYRAQQRPSVIELGESRPRPRTISTRFRKFATTRPDVELAQRVKPPKTTRDGPTQ